MDYNDQTYHLLCGSIHQKLYDFLCEAGAVLESIQEGISDCHELASQAHNLWDILKRLNGYYCCGHTVRFSSNPSEAMRFLVELPLTAWHLETRSAGLKQRQVTRPAAALALTPVPEPVALSGFFDLDRNANRPISGSTGISTATSIRTEASIAIEANASAGNTSKTLTGASIQIKTGPGTNSTTSTEAKIGTGSITSSLRT
ncbi:hypothetical protein MMC30_002900 [Trapelia coarctata]|nr:hypothetical protein [Trapelia coarctata]